MKRNILYALCVLLIVGGFSSCKKVQSKTINNKQTIVYKDGTTVTKIYKLTPGPKDSTQAEKPKKKEKKAKVEKPKHLYTFQAKRMLREELRKEEKEVYTAPIRIGYYECNNYAERLKLLKLAANKLITLQCDEIVTPYGSTYWVTVDLTWRGRLIKESPDKKLFPEDRITEEEAQAFLNPAWDQDQWGVPYTDSLVPQTIIDAVKAFYSSLQAGQSYDQSLLDAKMVCAISLLDSLASYGVNKLQINPFTRDMELTEEMVENISVLRMPRMQNAYLVTVGENSFLYVIEEQEEVTIVDLAYIAPEDIKSLDQTVCSLAGTLTKREILNARETKRMRDEYEARMRELMAEMPMLPEEQTKPADDFEMCETEGSLKMVKHDDPTLYELAKKAEHSEEVVLRAAVMKVTKLDEMKLEGNKKHTNATAQATYTLSKVNAVGRIYLGLKDGTKEEKEVYFVYTKKDGWVVSKEKPEPIPEPAPEPAPEPKEEVKEDLPRAQANSNNSGNWDSYNREPVNPYTDQEDDENFEEAEEAEGEYARPSYSIWY